MEAGNKLVERSYQGLRDEAKDVQVSAKRGQTTDSMSRLERSSLDAALNRNMQTHVAAGGRIFAGQFGQTVVQYPDYYLEGGGLSWARNQGQWTPLPTCAVEPDQDGAADGEMIWSLSGRRQWVWIASHSRWIEI